MKYTEDQLTEWFELKDVKPTEVGVYEVQNTHCTWTNYSYWDGELFKWLTMIKDSPNMAFKRRNSNTDAVVKQWRGLNFNPSETKPSKKTANKRKTMYIVSAWVNNGKKLKHVGAFSNHDNAVNAAKRYKQPRINKVRFRTPEA